MKNLIVNLNPWDIQWNKDILGKIGARVYCNKEYYSKDDKTFDFDPPYSDRKIGDIIKFFEDRPLTLCFQHNPDGSKSKPNLNGTDIYSPESYKWIGDMMVELVTKYKNLTIEPENELDANWDSRDMDGGSHAAFMTAIYDRVKNIDPSCKIMLPGLSLSRFPNDGIKFFQDLKNWIDKNNNGKIPFDIIPLHIYSVTDYSVPINQSDAIKKLQDIIPFIKNNFPNCTISINETGVSMVNGNSHSVKTVDGEDIEITAGKLLLQTINDFYDYDPIIKEVAVYNWQDNSGNAWDANCGLLAGDGRHRPALTILLDNLTDMSMENNEEPTISSVPVTNEDNIFQPEYNFEIKPTIFNIKVPLDAILKVNGKIINF